MRRALACIVFCLSGFACGGEEFAAEDASSLPDDATLPDGDGAARDSGMTSPDVATEMPADDGVPHAPGDAVYEEAAASDSGSPDAGADGSSDVAADVPLDAPSDRRADAATDGTTNPTTDAPVDATCDAPPSYYRDRDKDGFGVTAERLVTCAVPPSDDGTWSTQAGDCRDDLATVKPFKAGSPDPPKYSGIGYSDPVRPLGISFDFDCDGVETVDPSNMYGAAPPCGNLSTNCGQIGYLPAAPARGGIGVNGLCGSTMLRICISMGLNCNPTFAETTPFRCR